MLDGIKVIEYATYMAAPGAGSILSDWGAEVIKVEPPGGDPIRNFFRTIGTDLQDNPVFDFDNRGKKSIVLDTRTDEGQKILRELASDADVFLTNVRPGGLERSSLDFKSLIEINPKLVYCTLTGYGLQGPDADKPGFDVASFWSRAGVGHLTAPKGQDPFPLRTAYGDHTTSMAAAAGICAALVKASRTGQGQLVEASLLRAALFAMGSDFAVQLFFGRVASTKSRHELVQPLINFFKTKDDSWICIVSRQGNVDWPPLCRVMDRHDLIEDPRFTTGKTRRANAAELVDLMDAEIGKYTKAEIAVRLDNEAIAWAPVQTLAEVAKDPQVIAAGGITQVPSASGDGTSFASPASPIRFPGTDDGPKGPSPRQGEHSQDVLKSLGYDQDKIDTLMSAGVVV